MTGKLAGLLLGMTWLAPHAYAAERLPAGPQDAFERHVRAVQARDLQALAPTLTRGEALTLILPDGTRTSSKAEYLAFHERFFATPGWTIAFEPVSTLVMDETAVITTRSTFESAGEAGTSRSHNWVTFVFRHEDGDWRLVHDQNTRMPVDQRAGE